jgi:hypothetical protein
VVADLNNRETTMSGTQIREHMPVIAEGGMRIGTVDAIEGSSIRLMKSAPAAHGQDRYIPLDWVESVSDHVQLNKNSDEVEREWQEVPVADGAG